MVNITNGHMILVTFRMNNSEKMEQPPINNNTKIVIITYVGNAKISLHSINQNNVLDHKNRCCFVEFDNDFFNC